MKILIVDDEQLARERINALLQEMEGYEVVAQAKNGEQALSMAAEHGPDVVLMDIRMPGISGIETAYHLRALEEPPAVIFTTAYDDHALEAFGAQAVGYLLKPVRQEKLEATLKQAKRITKPQLQALSSTEEEESYRTHICARVGHNLHLVPLESIRYFQADSKYTNINHLEGEVLIDEPLKDLEEEFEQQFVRVHRNTLVSLDYLTAVEKDAQGKYYAVVEGISEPIQVSRRLAPTLRRRIRKGKSH